MPARASASVVVLVTAPDRAVATKLADTIVGKRVAACVNLVPGVESVYWWEGKVDRSQEILLIIKTTKRNFEKLRELLLAIHPYEVPEILALPIVAGHPAYLAWLASSVTTAP